MQEKFVWNFILKSNTFLKALTTQDMRALAQLETSWCNQGFLMFRLSSGDYIIFKLNIFEIIEDYDYFNLWNNFVLFLQAEVWAGAYLTLKNLWAESHLAITA